MSALRALPGPALCVLAAALALALAAALAGASPQAQDAISFPGAVHRSERHRFSQSYTQSFPQNFRAPQMGGGRRGRPRPAATAAAAATTPAAAAGAGAQTCGRTRDMSRVFGGEVAELGQFPWQAALFYVRASGDPERVQCGGALVHPRYVVTAAHCLHRDAIKGYTLTKVRLGEWDTSSERDCVMNKCAPPVEDFPVERQVLHPGYVARGRAVPGARHNEADVALLRLQRPAPYTDYIRPVCLPPAAAAARDLRSEVLVVAGWGLTEEGTYSDQLRFVGLIAQPLDSCRSSLNVDIQQTQLCVGGQQGKDSCTGDSGGPLLSTEKQGQDTVYQLVGLVSFGGVCGEKDRPAVYTRVAAFLPWLRENMRP